eukprot:snap_masked-scaffold_14-processed-gene-3.46-mRNA-1 protein AED:1.00 eAED:1.00 QI:0/0/0/0/1/1/2/0/61
MVRYLFLVINRLGSALSEGPVTELIKLIKNQFIVISILIISTRTRILIQIKRRISKMTGGG